MPDVKGATSEEKFAEWEAAQERIQLREDAKLEMSGRAQAAHDAREDARLTAYLRAVALQEREVSALEKIAAALEAKL